jgi:hypothetical protein
MFSNFYRSKPHKETCVAIANLQKKKKKKKKEIRLEDRTSYGLGMVIERAHILIP